MRTGATRPLRGRGAALDAEKLDVYRVAVQAQVTVAQLIPAEHRVLRDQVERASVSVVQMLTKLDAALA